MENKNLFIYDFYNNLSNDKKNIYSLSNDKKKQWKLSDDKKIMTLILTSEKKINNTLLYDSFGNNKKKNLWQKKWMTKLFYSILSGYDFDFLRWSRPREKKAFCSLD